MKQGIEKLYEKMPLSALGALAAGAFFRADNTEMQDILMATADLSTREQLKFKCISHNHTMAALLWAIDCHATYRQLLEFTVCITNLVDESERDSIMLLDCLIKATRRRLAALIAAMQKICETAGHEFEPIERIAGIDAQVRMMMADAPVSPKLVDELVAQYGVAA